MTPTKPLRALLLLVAVAAAVAGVTIWLSTRGDGGPSRSAAGQPSDDPVVFLRGVVREIASDHYARAWRTLHPAQQRVASQREYVRCELQTPIGGRLDWIRVVRVFDEPVIVAGGEATPVASKAVTFRLRLSQSSLGASEVVTHTVHVVAVGGRWVWILPPRRFAFYRSGTCAKPPVPTSSA